MNKLANKTQYSAGGVAFRRVNGTVQIAIISVGEGPRWQLPKGTISKGETNEEAAQREVREEAGVTTDLLELIDKVEYWFFSKENGQRTRIHKFVFFYLLKYLSGNVEDHDHEVNEARWVDIDVALKMLSFASERKVVERAKEMIADLP